MSREPGGPSRPVLLPRRRRTEPARRGPPRARPRRSSRPGLYAAGIAFFATSVGFETHRLYSSPTSSSSRPSARSSRRGSPGTPSAGSSAGSPSPRALDPRRRLRDGLAPRRRGVRPPRPGGGVVRGLGVGARRARPGDLPAPALPRRTTALAALASGGLVRGRGDRRRLRRRRAPPGTARGLPARQEPLRGRHPASSKVRSPGSSFLLAGSASSASTVSLVAPLPARAPGVEREQIKWLALAGAVAGVVVVVGSRWLRRLGRGARQRRDHARRPRAPGGRRRRDPALPALRHRRRDQPRRSSTAR